jgi:hypothetical protein
MRIRIRNSNLNFFLFLYQPYATYHSTLTQTANPTFLNVPGFFQSELRY